MLYIKLNDELKLVVSIKETFERFSNPDRRRTLGHGPDDSLMSVKGVHVSSLVDGYDTAKVYTTFYPGYTLSEFEAVLASGQTVMDMAHCEARRTKAFADAREHAKLELS